MRAPEQAECLLIRTAVLVEKRELDAARSLMARLTAVQSDFSVASEREYRRLGASPLMQRFLASLLQARRGPQAHKP